MNPTEEAVQLVNPHITVEGYKIGNHGFTNYILHADDMVKDHKEELNMRLVQGIVIDKEKHLVN